MAGDEQLLATGFVSQDSAEAEALPASTPSPVSGVVGNSIFAGDSGPGYWIDEDAEAPFRIEFAEGFKLAPGAVLRLSPTALWFAPSATERLPAREIRFYLKRGDWAVGPLRGRVVPLDARAARSCVGLKLIGVPLEAGRKIVALMNELVQRGGARIAHEPSPVLEEITSADRIAAIMTSLTAVGSGGALSISGKTVQAQIIEVDALAGRVVWKVEGVLGLEASGPEPVRGSIIGYNSVYRFSLTAPRESEGEIVCAMPERLERVRHRWFRRVQVRGGVRVRFEHPLWEDIEPAWRDVVDISLGGIRFRTDHDQDLLFPALNLPCLEIETETGVVIHLRGQVRNVLPARDGEPASCGASVTPLSPEDEIWWMRLVSGMLYNQTTQTSENLVEPLWDLLRDSGYMNLAGRSEGNFTYLKRRITSVSKRAAIAPQLMCQAVWPSSRGVEGSVSFCKSYKRSWMMHQVAKRKGTPEAASKAQVLRGIYTRGFEHSQSDPDMKWVISYVEGTVPWIARSHLAFAERFADSGETYAMPVRLVNAFCAETAESPASDFEVSPATPWEKMRLLATIARTRPNCYREALDFTSEQIDMSDVGREWRRFGFEREREILVARRGAQPIAAMVLEVGEIGTNLFCLLDCVRLFPLAPEGKRAYVQLLDEARAWFTARRRTQFLYYREDDDTSFDEAARLHDGTGQPYLCIMSARVLPDFLEHVCEVASVRRAG